MQTSSPAAEASGPPLTPQSTTVTPWADPSAAHLEHRVGGDGAHDDGGAPWRRAGEHAVGPLQDRPHLGVVEDHHQDHVAAGRQLRGRGRHMGPLPERRGGLLTDVADTVTGMPARIREVARPPPMSPRPMIPTRGAVGVASFSFSGTWTNLPIDVARRPPTAEGTLDLDKCLDYSLN